MNKAYNYALSLLAKREHSVAELTNKLEQKSFDSDIIALTIAKLKEQNFQSDARYAEMLCRARVRQGYGPLRIKQELNYKGISAYITDEVLATERENWVKYAAAVWQKKYKHQGAISGKDIQKQKSFLYSRGFGLDTIDLLFKQEFEF